MGEVPSWTYRGGAYRKRRCRWGKGWAEEVSVYLSVAEMLMTVGPALGPELGEKLSKVILCHCTEANMTRDVEIYLSCIWGGGALGCFLCLKGSRFIW